MQVRAPQAFSTLPPKQASSSPYNLFMAQVAVDGPYGRVGQEHWSGPPQSPYAGPPGLSGSGRPGVGIRPADCPGSGAGTTWPPFSLGSNVTHRWVSYCPTLSGQGLANRPPTASNCQGQGQARSLSATDITVDPGILAPAPRTQPSPARGSVLSQHSPLE